MDAGDYIYIIIAIVLAIVNAVANKKKKDAAKRKSAEPQPEEVLRDPADILQEILMGKSQEPKPQKEQPEWYAEEDDYEEIPSKKQESQEEKVPQYWSYEVKEEPVKSIEYEHRYEDISEEKLYPTVDSKLLDTPENAKFASIDNPESIESSIEEFNYESLSVRDDSEDEMPDMIFEHEKVLEMEASAVTVADEFDAKKAIIYSEIMRPKYI